MASLGNTPDRMGSGRGPHGLPDWIGSIGLLPSGEVAPLGSRRRAGDGQGAGGCRTPHLEATDCSCPYHLTELLKKYAPELLEEDE